MVALGVLLLVVGGVVGVAVVDGAAAVVGCLLSLWLWFLMFLLVVSVGVLVRVFVDAGGAGGK